MAICKMTCHSYATFIVVITLLPPETLTLVPHKRNLLRSPFTSAGKAQLPSSTNCVGCSFGITSESVYNVREFGAIGDGIVDDTAAIQRTIDACLSTKKSSVFTEQPVQGYASESRATNSTPGGIIYFPTGAYRIKQTLKFRDPLEKVQQSGQNGDIINITYIPFSSLPAAHTVLGDGWSTLLLWDTVPTDDLMVWPGGSDGSQVCLDSEGFRCYLHMHVKKRFVVICIYKIYFSCALLLFFCIQGPGPCRFRIAHILLDYIQNATYDGIPVEHGVCSFGPFWLTQSKLKSV